MYLLALLLSAMTVLPSAQAQRHPAAPAGGPFKTTLTLAEMAGRQAVVDTTAGSFVIDLRPDLAPNHVGYFIKLARDGVYTDTAFHRVVRGFVVQTGALDTRGPLTEKQQKLVHNLQPEFNGTNHVKGIVSMARGDDPASATTSFFIVTAAAPTLDGKYTVFGRIIDGLDVLDRIESTPVSGESPTTRIDLIKVRIAG